MDTGGERTHAVSTWVPFRPEQGRREKMAPQARKRTQRERLLKGMVEVANRRGYAGASVSAVIAEAGVSRPTFYDYFADRDECFTATIRDVQQALARQVEGALDGRGPERAVGAAIEAILAFADARSTEARFLTAESMSGGRVALDARDQGIAAIAAVIDAAQEGVRPRTPLGDLEHRVLVGSVYRLIATRLRRGEASLTSLAAGAAGVGAAHMRCRRPRGVGVSCARSRLQAAPRMCRRSRSSRCRPFTRLGARA